MTRDAATELRDLLVLRHDAELAALQSVLAEEVALRQKLADLSRHAQAAQAELGIDPTPRTIGADTLWQSWLGRSYSQLNTQLATVLVRKAGAQAKLRQAFGRKSVAEELVRREKNAAVSRKLRQDQETMLQLSLLDRLR